MSGIPSDPIKRLLIWYPVARDAVLIVTGLGIAIFLVVTNNNDPTLVGLALTLVGAGSYGRGHANGKAEK